MIETPIKLNLKLGLHARPSSYIVIRLKGLRLKKATLACNGRTADLNSILSLLMLYVNCGDTLQLTLDGPDEEKALKIIEDIFNEKDNDEIYESV